MRKYKNLKLNPKNKKSGVVTLRVLEEEYEVMRDLFDIIFVSVKMFDYKINVFRSEMWKGRIYLNFDSKETYTDCEFMFNDGIFTSFKIRKICKISNYKEIKFFDYSIKEHLTKSNILLSNTELVNKIYEFL